VKKQSISFLLAAALALPGLAMADLPSAAAQDAPAEGRERCRGHRGHRGGHGDPAARIEHRIERLTARLGLDDNQQALVRQAFEQARAEHEALRAQERSPERREAHRAIMQRTMERIDSFLTPEQRATMEQMRAQMRERFEGRRGRRGGRHGGPGAGGVDPRGI
jgi:Spy/CpxP family protein refolding chaperone